MEFTRSDGRCGKRPRAQRQRPKPLPLFWDEPSRGRDQ
ncbi:hypothetical protein JDM601_3992 [Mycolicibacter sinensis]|uniref:Uncharacterized protein n=1 Tax=Mycolicibacter sinensis (strain JDM601) TaxID=875328 RepID=F5YT03_MYCSD|nr:hypothetical protein JDM601_3992 [Mycolicibacter sinensis]